VGFARRSHEPVIKTPEDAAWHLTASFGNVHSFTAKEATVVLDVLMPPYKHDGDRDCRYYRVEEDFGGSANEASQAVLLREVPEPMRRLPSYYPYPGPVP